MLTPSPEAQTAADEAVDERLETFDVIRSRRLRQVVSALPAVLGLVLLYDLLVGLEGLIGRSAFAGDWFRISFAVGIILEFVVINKVFAEVPRTLAIIWRRDLIANPAAAGERVAERFNAFLDRFEALLNHKGYALVVGLLVSLAILRGTYPFVYRDAYGTFPGAISPVVFAESFVGFFFGLFAWRYAVIAFMIGRLASNFKLEMQAQHPDRCGGLEPLGNLCLWNALILVIPAIILALWLGVATLPRYAFFELWSSLFRQYLMVLTVLSIFLFFYPVGKIHQRMAEARGRMLEELDALTARADAILGRLRNEVDSLPAEESDEYLEKLATYRRVFEENASIPAWPFDWRIALKFSVAQVVPVLSLFGLGQPLVNVIQSLLSALPEY